MPSCLSLTRCCKEALLCAGQVAIRDESDSDSEEDLEPAAAEAQNKSAPSSTAEPAAPAPPGTGKEPAKRENPVVNIRADSSSPALVAPAPAPAGAPAVVPAGAEQTSTLEQQPTSRSEQEPHRTAREQQPAGPVENLGGKVKNHSNAAAGHTGAPGMLPAAPVPEETSSSRVPAARPQGARKRARREGTALGAGLRLMAYCARHSRLAHDNACQFGVSIATGRLLAQGGPASPRAPAPQPPPLPCPAAAAGSRPAAADKGPRTHQQEAASTPGCAENGSGKGDEGPCARCQAYGQARRGRRAPDALAVALAKRAFVRAVPYRVGFAPRRPHLLPSSAGSRGAAEKHSSALLVADAAALGAGSDARKVPSLAERFAAMTRSVPQRLTCGACSSLCFPVSCQWTHHQ